MIEITFVAGGGLIRGSPLSLSFGRSVLSFIDADFDADFTGVTVTAL